MARQEREILERAVRALAQKASAADSLVDEAPTPALTAPTPSRSTLVLDCSDCGRTVHWVAGLGVTPGHWAHREPAPFTSPPFECVE